MNMVKAVFLICILTTLPSQASLNCQDYFQRPRFPYDTQYERVLTPTERPDVWLVHVDLGRFPDAFDVYYSENRIVNFSLVVSKKTGRILKSIPHAKSFKRGAAADNLDPSIRLQYSSRLMEQDAYWSADAKYFLKIKNQRLELFNMDYATLKTKRIAILDKNEIQFLQNNKVFIKEIPRDAHIFLIEFINNFEIYWD